MLLDESNHSSFYAHSSRFTSSQDDDWVSRTSNRYSKQPVVSKADSWFCCRNQTLRIAHLSCMSSLVFLIQRFYSLSYMNETRWVHSLSAKPLHFSNISAYAHQTMHCSSLVDKGKSRTFFHSIRVVIARLLEVWGRLLIQCLKCIPSTIYTAAKHY